MQWVPVPSLNGYISVTRCGKIKTHDREVPFTRNGTNYMAKFKGKEINPWIASNGYLYIALKRNGKRKKYLVHRLLGEVFVPGFNKNLTINHLNGNKLDNNIENLEWIPLADNTKHQWEAGLVDLRGSNHPGAKLTPKQVKAIRKMIALGVPDNCIATLSPVSCKIISRIRNGCAWNNV